MTNNQLLSNNALKNGLCFLIILLPFLLTRLQFFLYYPVIDFGADTDSYFLVMEALEKGEIPILDIRTIGFPLFAWLISSAFGSNLALIAANSILVGITALCIVSLSIRTYPRYSLAISFWLSFFINLPIFVVSESAFYTESLYIVSLLWTFLFLWLGVKFGKKRYWGLFSILMAWSILVRPSALFFVVIFVFVIFFLWKQANRKTLAVFVFPFLSILGVYSVYNYVSAGFLGITAFGEYNIIGVVTTYMKPSQKYSPELNKVIEATIENVSTEHQHTVKNSWDIENLHYIFHRNHVLSWTFCKNLSTYADSTKSPADGKTMFIRWRSEVRRICQDAIIENPLVYAKFVGTQFLYYFFLNGTGNPKMFNGTIAKRIYSQKIQKAWENAKDHNMILATTFSKNYNKSFWEFALKEYYKPDYPNIFYQNKGEEKPILPYMKEYLSNYFTVGNHEIFINTKTLNTWAIRYWQLQEKMLLLQTFWFNLLLGLSLFGVSGASAWRFYKSGFADSHTFFVFIVTISAIGQGLLVCLVESAMERYSYSFLFASYLALILLIDTILKRLTWKA